MAATERAHGMILDPHTAVGVVAARRRRRAGVPMVALATAHPAKFPDAVTAAIGHAAPVPAVLAAMETMPERCDTLPAETGAVKAYIEAFIGGKT